MYFSAADSQAREGIMVTGMIGIRADANAVIAAGHIMRCITIAGQLKEQGEEVLFFTADEYAKDMLVSAGMEYICLNSSWKEPEQELPALLNGLKERGCRKLLIDTYEATSLYIGELKKICRVIYIDDMFADIYPADMIINYNAYHVRFPYREAYRGKARLLLGTSYVPLREEFSADRTQTDAREEASEINVLLSCGGGDMYNALAGILETAVNRRKLEKAVFHTVVGGFNKQAGLLEALAGRYPWIVLHRNVRNMAELMKDCDLAVSAAGTVLFELCAMRLPTVFFVCADNQRYDREFFEKEDRMLFAGDIRKDREGCLLNICENLEKLMQDKALCRSMKGKLSEVTDGRGAARIAEEIRLL